MSRMNALCLAVVIIVILTISAALAHGDAQWIADGRYKDRENYDCCGPTDCKVAGSELRRIDGGWLHVPTNTTILDGQQGIYPSIDLQTWICVRLSQLRCVFRPSGA